MLELYPQQFHLYLNYTEQQLHSCWLFLVICLWGLCLHLSVPDFALINVGAAGEERGQQHPLQPPFVLF